MDDKLHIIWKMIQHVVPEDLGKTNICAKFLYLCLTDELTVRRGDQPATLIT